MSVPVGPVLTNPRYCQDAMTAMKLSLHNFVMFATLVITNDGASLFSVYSPFACASFVKCCSSLCPYFSSTETS